MFGLLLAFACSEKVIDRKKRSIIHTWRVLVPLRRKVYSIPNEAIVTVISEERSVKGGGIGDGGSGTRTVYVVYLTTDDCELSLGEYERFDGTDMGARMVAEKVSVFLQAKMINHVK